MIYIYMSILYIGYFNIYFIYEFIFIFWLFEKNKNMKHVFMTGIVI